jgi:hypothetical protein
MMQKGESELTCPTCASQEFDEDADGALTCVYCGTLSQDVILESHDGDDAGIYSSRMGKVGMKQAKYRKSLSGNKNSDVNSDIHDLLLCYQHSLQLLLKATFLLIFPSNENGIGINPQQDIQTSLHDQLKTLWMKYLYQWNACSSGCSFKTAFDRTQYCICQPNNLCHPLFPSKPLLLGFLYLALRLERLDVLPADLVRWCERGLLPYVNLWEHLPEMSKRNVNKKNRWLFMESLSNKTMFITPMNIWFHTCSLAKSIDLLIPTLNAPLVAKGMISALALPKQVWTMYVRITHILNDATPLYQLDAINQHHSGWIMANILLALMLCEYWQEWELHYTYDLDASNILHRNNEPFPYAIPNPIYHYDLFSLPRQYIPILLSQIRKCQHHYLTTQRKHHSSNRKHKFTYNEAVLKVLHARLNKNGQIILDEESEEDANPSSSCSTELWKELTPTSLDIQLPTEAMIGCSIGYECLSGVKRLYEKKLITTHPNVEQSRQGFVSYVSHVRHNDDTTGLYPMHYTAWIERCAKYIYAEPYVLHKLVETLDAQIIELAVDGKVLSASVEALQNKRHKLLRTRRKQTEKKKKRTKHDEKLFRAYEKLHEYSSALLPMAQQLGAEDLLTPHGVSSEAREGSNLTSKSTSIMTAERYYDWSWRQDYWKEDHSIGSESSSEEDEGELRRAAINKEQADEFADVAAFIELINKDDEELGDVGEAMASADEQSVVSSANSSSRASPSSARRSSTASTASIASESSSDV